MSHPDGVQTNEGRLATFSASQPAKRRASATRKRAAATLTWPHESPNADDLCKAGFYFAPSSSSPDNCRCFLCEVQLDGWEDGDNPAVEHYTHSSSCGWAVNCYVKHMFESNQSLDEDPLSAEYADARTATFQGTWPHENKRGWKCKVSKMVEAGWYFDPGPNLEDGVSCAYCSLSLGGWEPKDDPRKEHERREPNCPFFVLAKKFEATRPSKTKSSRQSKTSRVSTMSTVTIQSDMISVIGSEDGVDDTALTAVTTSSKAGKGQKTKGKGQGRKKKVEAAPMEDAPMDEAPVADEIVEPSPPKKQRKAKPKRQVSRKVSAQVDGEESQATKKAPRRKNASAESDAGLKRGMKRMSDGSEKESSEATIVGEPRGTKRDSEGIPKDEIRIYESPAKGTTTPPAARPKRGRPKKAILVDASPDVVETAIPKKKGGAKARKPLGELSPETVVRRSLDTRTVPPEPKRHTPEPAASDTPSTAPSTPTPAPSRLSSAKRAAAASQHAGTPTMAPANVGTPADSPQSSDAENKPPSSRPALHGLRLNDISPLRVALHSTPKTSPRKAGHVVSRLRTDVAWSPTDIENIFLASPAKAAAGKDQAYGVDPDMSMSDLSKETLASVVGSVRANMSAEEKVMTVEQWVRWNAKRGEDELKAKCEAMVTIFERQGAKAQRALDGIRSMR